ncbi:ethylmalonyl-CoA decarboxylase isoform X4 [Notamacropus eugenii]|uniref:ethylmalonyl-CoA decarboxylase isoform X4 n=1 Tax=Notamacropus eugenii TaxID=9315 RepID=UPI003B6840AB
MDGASAALSDKPSSAPPSQQGGVRPEHPHEGQPAPSQEMAASFLKTSSLSVRKKLIQQTGFPLYSTSHGFHEEDVKKKLQQFTGGSIDLRKEDCGIGILTFNNPSKKNAFSGVMMLQLLERVIDLENWKEGKGLIVCGAKNTFCSGSDLSAVKSLGTSQDGAELCMFMQNTLTRFMRLPLISVALIQGKAMGGGAELTTACDFRKCSGTQHHLEERKGTRKPRTKNLKPQIKPELPLQHNNQSAFILR